MDHTHSHPMDHTLYDALASGDIVKLQQTSSEILLHAKTPLKNTALHVAVQFRNRNKCVEEVYRKCPELLKEVNLRGETALHIAVRTGLDDVVKFLIDLKPKDLEDQGRLTRMVNMKKDTLLHEAVRNCHYNIVKMITQADTGFQYLANDAEETPVYLAAELGSKDMVKQIVNTCQSVDYEGPDGKTALHAAILLPSTDVAMFLFEKEPESAKKRDKKGWTPLHCAACTGNTKIIDKIIQHFPYSWEILNDRGENFLHVATVHGQDKVVANVLQLKNYYKFVEDLINQPDIDGNTPLHLAAYYNHIGTIRLLSNNTRVNKNVLNNENKTPRNVIKETMEDRKAYHILRTAGGTLSRRKRVNQRQERDCEYSRNEKRKLQQRNKIFKDGNEMRLVVAGLILTVTFTAGISLPGGFKSDSPDQGTSLLSGNAAFKIFVLANNVAVAFSLYAVFLHFVAATIPPLYGAREVSVVREAAFFTFLALLPMAVAFVTGSYAVLSNSPFFAMVSSQSFVFCVMTFFFIMGSRVVMHVWRRI